MADSYNEPDINMDNFSFPRGRGGRRHGTGRTGWRGHGSGERGNERSRGGTMIRGSGTTWRFGARGGRNAPTRDALEGQPMGDLLGTITLTELRSSVHLKDTALTITDCQYVASYNWLNGQNATILVPGAPPVWSPPKDRPKLKEDKDTYLRDLNAARYPHFPTEPAIRAVFALHPDFDTAAIDVVGCGNTMGNLIMFAKSYERTFRFYIEVVGNTVFLVRKGNSPTEEIEGVHGYGHTFPEAYTSWEADVKNSVSHQRLIQYVFGGLRCLVRYKSDGYLKDHVHSKSQQLPTSSNSSGLARDDGLPSLLRAAKSIAVGEKIPNETFDLSVRSAGHEVPQTAIFDLKTRSARREIDMEEMYPRLWVSQIPKFIIAYHNSGQFHDIQVQDLGDRIQTWEKTNRDLLYRFNQILRQLIGFAKQSECHKVEVRRIAMGPLQIRKQSEDCWNVLPPDLKAKWAGRPINENYGPNESVLTREETTEIVSGGDEDDGLDDYLRF